jgi:prepilin peptidase CpaA
MYGTTDLLFYPVLAISAIAAVTDLIRGKIYNWLTFPALALGLIASFASLGWPGLLSGFLGTAIAFGAYAWIFLLGAMGAGDVKLLMALGAWGGPRFAFEVALLGVLLGGALGVLLLVWNGRIGSFGRRMYHFLLTIFVRQLEPELPKLDAKQKMPFGIPIAAAAVWILLSNPLPGWGLRLW